MFGEERLILLKPNQIASSIPLRIGYQKRKITRRNTHRSLSELLYSDLRNFRETRQWTSTISGKNHTLYNNVEITTRRLKFYFKPYSFVILNLKLLLAHESNDDYT